MVPTGSLISKQDSENWDHMYIYIYIKHTVYILYMCVSSVKPLPRPDWNYPASHGTSTNKRSLSQPLYSMKNVRNHQFSCQTCQTCTYQDFKLQTINLHLNHADSLRYLPVLNSWLRVQRNMIAPSTLILIITWCGWVDGDGHDSAIYHSDFKGNAVSSCHQAPLLRLHLQALRLMLAQGGT